MQQKVSRIWFFVASLSSRRSLNSLRNICSRADNAIIVAIIVTEIPTFYDQAIVGQVREKYAQIKISGKVDCNCQTRVITISVTNSFSGVAFSSAAVASLSFSRSQILR